jgi:hypothetical protein
MPKFSVYRSGYNVANHSSLNSRSPNCLIGQYEADDEEGAIAQAVAAGATCYNGQFFYANDADVEVKAEIAKGQYRVEYWMGTTAVTDYCDTYDDVRESLEMHSNAHPPHVYDTETGEEINTDQFYCDDDDEDESLVCGCQIQVDRSGQGHCWENIDADDIPASVRMEIEGEIIDGGKDACDGFIASNGLHYRW